MRLTVTMREAVIVQDADGWRVHWLGNVWGPFTGLREASAWVNDYRARYWRAPAASTTSAVEVA